MMNREQRRAHERLLSHQQAQRRPARPIRAPLIVGADLVLRPLEQIVEQLERDGSATVDGKGIPVFLASDGRWYEAASAIEGLIWHFEMWATRHGKDLPLDSLRELRIALHYIVPIQPSTITKLGQAIPVLRRVISTGNPDDQVDLLRQTQIKAELETRTS